jgi:hypothetical protein
MHQRIACLAAALCCATAAFAADREPTLSKDAYKAQQQRIEAEYDAAQARCKPMKGIPRDVCNEQVRGQRDIAVAELEMQYKPSADADEKVRIAKAEAVYAVALQRCKEFDGSTKEICRKDAKAVFAGARAEAKLQKEVVAQNLGSELSVRERTAAQDRLLEAQFNAARERCGMLPAEGQANCLADARRRFGKP